MSRRRPYSHATPSELVAAALAHDECAWDEIIDRYHLLVWKAVNMKTSNEEDRDEAYARTWCRLNESLATIREPDALPGWLRITAVREVYAVARFRTNAVPVDDVQVLDGDGGTRARSLYRRPEQEVLDAEVAAAVRQAFHELDAPCRELLTLLIVQDPPLSYAEVERRLSRPHGSIGPTRGRCLEKLRRSPALQALFGCDPGDGRL